MYTYGVGALVDLPNFAVVVAGLDDWGAVASERLDEKRLLAAVRSHLGPQLTELRAAPWKEPTRNVFDDWTQVGIPVLPFPRWMRCPACGQLAAVRHAGAGLFRLEVPPSRPDLARFVHEGCARSGGRPPTAVPARFVVACVRGHIDEFPWIEFCHHDTGGTCPSGAPQMEVRDRGRGTRSTDVIVKCRACQQVKAISHAFNDAAHTTMPRCRGREAHLRRFDADGCPEQVRPMLLGASNAWFPVSLSALAIPASADPLGQALDAAWDELAKVTSAERLEMAIELNPRLTRLADFRVGDVWAAITARRSGPAAAVAGDVDLKRPEWAVLSDPAHAPSDDDFLVSAAQVPRRYADQLDRVVQASRLREVVALVGFTRVDGPDSGVASDVHEARVAPLSREKPTWVPAAEVRGEGLFVTLPEAAVREWEERAGADDRLARLRDSHVRWRERRGLDPAGWPGERFVLVHSLAHLLINEFALECGYNAASLRERIYTGQGGTGQAMAGVLIYTAAADSEGTLGGLVSLGRPETLERLLSQALDRAQLCAADPLCAEHVPETSRDSLHLAACHACLFVPETSCEIGNRYLDRAAVVPTLTETGLAYFQPWGAR
jgi:hypothetical protein